MQQKYCCPNCRARVVCGERFCGNCGVNLTRVAQPAPADGAVTPISKEISKLLADFEKHIKYSHTR